MLAHHAERYLSVMMRTLKSTRAMLMPRGAWM